MESWLLETASSVRSVIVWNVSGIDVSRLSDMFSTRSPWRGVRDSNSDDWGKRECTREDQWKRGGKMLDVHFAHVLHAMYEEGLGRERTSMRKISGLTSLRDFPERLRIPAPENR